MEPDLHLATAHHAACAWCHARLGTRESTRFKCTFARDVGPNIIGWQKGNVSTFANIGAPNLYIGGQPHQNLVLEKQDYWRRRQGGGRWRQVRRRWL